MIEMIEFRNGCRIHKMTTADRIRALWSYGSRYLEYDMAERCGVYVSYVNKIIGVNFSWDDLESKWMKRMAKDLTRGMQLHNGMTFLEFTKSKEYMDVANRHGMIERLKSFEVLCMWRSFYGV